MAREKCTVQQEIVVAQLRCSKFPPPRIDAHAILGRLVAHHCVVRESEGARLGIGGASGKERIQLNAFSNEPANTKSDEKIAQVDEIKDSLEDESSYGASRSQGVEDEAQQTSASNADRGEGARIQMFHQLVCHLQAVGDEHQR